MSFFKCRIASQGIWILLLFRIASAQRIQPFLQLSSKPGDACLEACSFVESSPDASDNWFQRVGSPIPEMSHPIMKYRYCEYESEDPDSPKRCGSTEFTHSNIRDGEDFDAFFDEVSQTSGDPTHTAVGHSRQGTVCFYHYRWRNSYGGCRTACLGLQSRDERHMIPLAGTSDLETLQHVEIWFEENPDRCEIQEAIEAEQREEDKENNNHSGTRPTQEEIEAEQREEDKENNNNSGTRPTVSRIVMGLGLIFVLTSSLLM